MYPFLHDGTSDLASVLAEVRRSTAEMAAEIVALRESLVRPHSPRLIECAHRLAESFQAQGKLFDLDGIAQGTGPFFLPRSCTVPAVG